MKSYILIYAYTVFSEEETNFWNKLNTYFVEKGYRLFLLAPIRPKYPVSFSYALFEEKLDNVIFNQELVDSYKDNFEYEKILERESIWYGNSAVNRLDKAKCQRRLYTQLIEELNPSIIVLANGHHASEQLLKHEAYRKQIPLTYFERGCLPNSWHIDDTGITAGTAIARVSYLDKFKNENTDNFHFFKEYYLSKKITWWKQPETKSIKNIRERFKIPYNKKVVLFANQLDNDTSNFLYSPFFESNFEAFNWFCEKVLELELNCFVLVKKHPWYNGVDDFESVFKHKEIDGAWIDDIDIFDCFKECDLFCSVNSTAMYESMLYNLPSLQLGESILSNKDIAYEIKDLADNETILNWFDRVKFQSRLNKFSEFISYMINNELAFFSVKLVSNNFNGAEFFGEKILNRVEQKTKGLFPKTYVKYRFGYDFYQKRNGKIINRILRRIRKL